jgi:hypothetical protein
MMGLLDFLPSDQGWVGDPSKGMIGLLSPQDRLMALFQGLSQAGAKMATPGLSRGQSLAVGLGGLGEGMAAGNQNALTQRLLGSKLAEEGQKQAWKKTLADAFGDNGMPGPSMAAAPGQTVAQGLADRMNGARQDKLADPKVQGALMGLYGPQGLAALRTEDKAPETVEGYDRTSGQPTRFMFNRQTRQYDIPVGGSKVDATKPVWNAEAKRWEYAPGVIDAEAAKEGATTGARERAGLAFAGPKAAASAAATLPFDIQKMWSIPRVEPPGARVVAGGAAGQPLQVISQSPNPAPGTQEGKYGQGIGELQSKTVEGWRNDAQAGVVVQQNVARMRDAMDSGLKTGTFAPVRDVTVRALADLGVSQDSLNKYFSAKDAKTFDSAAKELVLPVIKSLGANPTNTDRDFIEKTIPQLRDNPEAVRALLDWMDKRAQSKIDLYQQGYAHAAKGGDPLAFEQDWWKKQMSGGRGGWTVTAVP